MTMVAGGLCSACVRGGHGSISLRTGLVNGYHVRKGTIWLDISGCGVFALWPMAARRVLNEDRPPSHENECIEILVWMA